MRDDLAGKTTGVPSREQVQAVSESAARLADAIVAYSKPWNRAAEKLCRAEVLLALGRLRSALGELPDILSCEVSDWPPVAVARGLSALCRLRDKAQGWLDAGGAAELPVDGLLELAEELRRSAELSNSAVAEKAPEQPDGLDAADVFWWNGNPHYAAKEWRPAVRKLLRIVWGRRQIPVSELAAALGKPKRTKYASLKPTVTRLNSAMAKEGLPFSWGKERGENTIFCKGPALAVGFRSVSK